MLANEDSCSGEEGGHRGPPLQHLVAEEVHANAAPADNRALVDDGRGGDILERGAGAVELIVVLAAPHYRRLASSPRVRAFVAGVTAAAAGALSGAVFVLAQRAITDALTLAIAVCALLCAIRFKRFPEPAIILVAGLVGVAAILD